MEKVTFEKFTKFADLNGVYGEYGEWFEGEGVYRFVMGSRGEIDEVVKVSDDNSFMMKSKEEIIESVREKYGDELEEWMEDEFDEFCYSMKGESVFDFECEVYWENYGEEDGCEYYWVKE